MSKTTKRFASRASASVAATIAFAMLMPNAASATTSCDARHDLTAAIEKTLRFPWSEIRESCAQEIDAYNESDMLGYTWFVNAANGFSGTPLLMLKALPDLAPEIWGSPEENFSKFGLFSDPDDPDRVLPRGLGIASTGGRPLNENGFPTGEIDYTKPGMYVTSFACGACHSGQVRVDGQFQVLEGAPNTRFDVRSWRQAFVDTRAKYLTPEQIGTPDAPGETATKMLAYIDAQPAGFFARGLPLLSQEDEAQIDAQQRAIFKQSIFPVLNGVAHSVRASDWMVKLQKKAGSNYGYPGYSPGLAGHSTGQSDGSGDLLAQWIAVLANAKEGMTEEAFLNSAHVEVPPFATVTDSPSVWNQRDRAAAQWDGSVSMGFWRNIAAQLPIVGDPSKVDLHNTHIVDKFLRDLPSSPYPFDVDLALAAKGEPLYQENCAGCHKPENSRPYWEMNTDFNRAQVLNTEARNLFLTAFTAACHDKEYSYVDESGETIKPCTMDGTQIIRDTTQVEEQGYMSSVLDGIWARAPYLHNGSVPTLRHLLVPSERPKTFLRGAVDYDRSSVGWVWQTDKKAEFEDQYLTLIVYDTGYDGLSNQGHDRDLIIDGKKYRLDWSSPALADDLAALLEYMKTL